MNILVTGGSGFVGRNIVKQLKEEGNTVATLDINGKNSVADYHIMSDIRNLHMVEGACKGIDYVFHLAAATSSQEFENLLSDGYDINVIGTYNILAASAKTGVKRIILASTSSVYGFTNGVMKEDVLPESHANLYSLSKRINEYTANFFQEYGLETISLRYFNTYGMGESSKGASASVVWKFMENMKNRKSPEIYGDGKQSRDFTYVKDAARASILAMKKGKPGEVYNVGTGRATDFNTLFSLIKMKMKYRGEPKYVPNPLKSYQLFTQADMDKTRNDLGFNSEFDIAKGIEIMAEAILSPSA